jgi:hypothetical protein
MPGAIMPPPRRAPRKQPCLSDERPTAGCHRDQVVRHIEDALPPPIEDRPIEKPKLIASPSGPAQGEIAAYEVIIAHCGIPRSTCVGRQATIFTMPIQAPTGSSLAQSVPNSLPRITRSGSSGAKSFSKRFPAWTRSQPRCEHRQLRVSCTLRGEHQRLAHGCQRETAFMTSSHAA